MIVDYGEMDTLLKAGMTAPTPINGPNDGGPLYMVPAAALKILKAASSSQQPKRQPLQDIPIDPGLLCMYAANANELTLILGL